MRERKVPMRKCVGCMESKEKQSLIRIAAYEGKLTPDPTGRSNGRGIYLCNDNPECWEKAYKKHAFERALKGAVTPAEKERLFVEIREICDAK